MSTPDRGSDWIEKVVKAAALVGLNPVQVRWRLMRWQQRLERSRRRAASQVEHIRYAHKVCPRCGQVADRGERRCPACGTRLSSRAVQMLERIGLSLPHVVSVSSLLGLAMIGIYVRMIVAQGGGGLMGFRSDILLRFGAHWPFAVWHGEPWRLATAMFLHLGVWHIGFNLLALSQIGPAIEHIYGRGRMLFFFMVTGVVANLGSEAFGLAGMSAGASGALMGLIGVAAGWGQRDGTTIGREVRNRMLQWGLYTLLFGFFIHADNAAHGVGFVSGAALGYLVRPGTERPALRSAWLLASGVGAVAAVATVALALFPIASTRTMAMMNAAHRTAAPRDIYRSWREACALHQAGRTAEAAKRLEELLPSQGGPADVAAYCQTLAKMQQECRALQERGLDAVVPREEQPLDPAARRALEARYRRLCEAITE